jgi:cytochrome c556
MARTFTIAALAIIALTASAAPLVGAPARTARTATPPPSPAELVRTRVAGYREMGAAFKNTMDSLRGDPQIIVIQQSARTIKATSQAQYRWFPAGSGLAPGLKTLAKPEIWTKPAEFRAAQDQLVRAADALQAAATSGNADAIRGAARGLGGACKNCHDQFRVPPAQ